MRRPWHARRSRQVLLTLAMALMLAGCASAPPPAKPAARDERTPADHARQRKAPGPMSVRYCLTDTAAPLHAQCKVKLGMPKAEAAALLTDRQRRFAEGLRRIYTEPGFLTRRGDALAALGAELPPTCKRLWPGIWDGEERRTDRIPGDGLFSSNPYRQSRYTYSTRRDASGSENGRTWTVWLWAALETRRACLPSRAVEGYLDVPLSSRVVNREDPPDAWDRHGPGEHRAVGEQLSDLGPRMEMHIVDGCVMDVYFMFDFDFVAEDVSDSNASE